MTALLTEVASGLAFPEGPVMLPDGEMMVVEIAKGCVTRNFTLWLSGSMTSRIAS